MNDDTIPNTGGANAGGTTAYQTPPSPSAGSDITASIENAAGEAVDFVTENVGLVIAGGLAIGLVAAALLPRKKKAKISEKTRDISAIVTELALALTAQASAASGQASDAAAKGSDRIGSLSKAISETIVEHSQDLGKQAQELGKQAQQIASDTADQLNDSGKAIARAAVKLIEKVRG